MGREQGKPVRRGTRVPLLALGRFARRGAVSHVVLDHSSIVRFLEYNFLGPTGQLNAADGRVNNLGSLLDPSRTGIQVPEANDGAFARSVASGGPRGHLLKTLRRTLPGAPSR